VNLAVLRILSGKILERLSLFAERFQTMPNKIGWKSEQQKTPAFTGISLLSNWLRGLDLNQRPSGYEPDVFLPSRSRTNANNHRRIQRFNSDYSTLKMVLVSLLYHLILGLPEKFKGL